MIDDGPDNSPASLRQTARARLVVRAQKLHFCARPTTEQSPSSLDLNHSPADGNWRIAPSRYEQPTCLILRQRRRVSRAAGLRSFHLSLRETRRFGTTVGVRNSVVFGRHNDEMATNDDTVGRESAMFLQFCRPLDDAPHNLSYYRRTQTYWAGF